MTEEQALARIMEIIQADLPEAETRVEIAKVVDEYGQDRFGDGFDDGRAFASTEAGE